MTTYFKIGLLPIAILLVSLSALAQSNPLVGTWRLIGADKILPDGQQVQDYGSAPTGIAIFTPDNHYMVDVFKTERLKFASGDRSKGTPEEYKDAVMSTSCHFGTYSVDVAKGTITYHIERSSFPNYDQTTRTNTFTLKGDTLSWRVPARPDGSIPVSTFVRIPASPQSTSRSLPANVHAAAAVLAGDALYISGHIAIDPATDTLVTTSFRAEVKQVMENIGKVLRKHDLYFSDLVNVTVYLTDMDHYNEMNEIYTQYFGTTYPARVCVAVKQLPLNANIEICATASLTQEERR